MQRLAGKVALITGAGQGFGRAIAEGFAREGCALALTDEDGGRLGEVGSALGPGCPGLLATACDVTRRADVDGLVAAVIDRFGQIDVLVNTTGRSHNQSFLEFSETDFDDCLAIGLKSYFLVAQAVARHMASRRRGRIINVTSIVGRIGSGEAVGWCAARGGVDAMTRAMAHALGFYNITVNALARGAQVQGDYLPEEAAERQRRIPLGRLGLPEDVVGPAIFLASDESAFVTGDVLYVDGGYTSAAVTDDRFRPEWARAPKQ